MLASTDSSLIFIAYLISLPVMITAIVAIRVNHRLGQSIEILTQRVDLKAAADVAAFNVLSETAASVKLALTIQEDAVKLALTARQAANDKKTL